MTAKSQFQQTLKQIHKAQDKIAPLIEGLEDDIPQQSMKDYFVKLQILIKEDDDQKNSNYETVSGQKKEVELADIFNKLTEDGIEPTKLLILGGAGVGKTTLMQYIGYRWGTGELWQDRFDYVYRVSLKTLLNDHWKDDYSKEELREDILKCLVHYNIVMRLSDEMDEPSLKEMHWSAETAERTLLLLDGYDEIAHLKNSSSNSNSSKDYQRLEKKIFEHKHLIFTSRPNAIGKTMKTQFDKVLENTGLSQSGIEHYFKIYFRDDKKGKEAELRHFLAGNQVIWQICTVPVNIAMVCYIWLTSKSSDNLRQISTASSLYKNVIDRLGQRYFAKEWNEKEKTDRATLEETLANGEFILDEFRVLAHVAYKALTGGGINVAEENRVETLIIRGSQDKDGEIDLADQDGISIQSSINYLAGHKIIQDDQNKKVNVGKVCRYGLLKVEGTVSSLNNKKSDINAQRLSYSFLHLTFQEYLAAYYLKEQLTSDKVSEKEKRDICQYIAEHRNEPRYLMMLKFMAGIITADQNAKAEYAVKVFWDAIICNVDGVIELGIETKISLMIHLLGQAKINGKIDPRIPHKDEAFSLIDGIVLSDLFGWAAQLKESDFMTDTIKEAVIHALVDDNLSWTKKKLAQIYEKSSSSLREAIQKLIKKESGKDARESGQPIGTIIGLAIRMMNEVNLKLTTDECLTVIRRLKEIVITHEKQPRMLLNAAMKELAERKPKSPLPDKENLEFLDTLVPMILDRDLRDLSLNIIKNIVQTSGTKDMTVKTMEKIDSLVTHKQFLAMNTLDQINFKYILTHSIATVLVSGTDKTLIPTGFDQIIDRLDKIQDALDAAGFANENIPISDSSAIWTISQLFSLADDKVFVAKALEKIINREKQRNYEGSLTGTDSICEVISTLRDKDIIAACVSQIIPFLSSEENETTQKHVIDILVRLGNLSKDKTTVLKILQAIDHFFNKNSKDNEELKANALRALGQVIVMTDDLELAKKEMQRIFKLIKNIDASHKHIAITGAFIVCEKYKDKELATNLMECINADDHSVPNVRTITKFARSVGDQKEVMQQIVDYISRLLSKDNVKTKFDAMNLAEEFFYVFKDKVDTTKLIESLMSLYDHEAIKYEMISNSRFLFKHPAFQQALPRVHDKFVGFLTGTDPEARDLAEKTSSSVMNKSFKTKIIEHAMRLLDDDKTEIICSCIHALRHVIQITKDKETATYIAKRLAKLLNFGDLTVKERAIVVIDEMLGFIENDEFAAQLIEQPEVSSLLETLNYSMPKLIQAKASKLVKKNDLESLALMIDRMGSLLFEQESYAKVVFTLDNLKAVFQVTKDKHLAEKAIHAILRIIPSHQTSEIFHENLRRIKEKESSKTQYYLDRKPAESAIEIIHSLEDRKLAVKFLEHITIPDDPQAKANWSMIYITWNIIALANDDRLTAKVLKEFLRMSSPSLEGRVWPSGIEIITNFWVPLEQVSHYMQSGEGSLRGDLAEAFITKFSKFLGGFSTMEKLLKNPQNLTLDIIKQQLFDNQLTEALETEIKSILSTLKDDQTQSTSVEKLKEILISHLNKIGYIKKHELIEPVLIITGCIERHATMAAHRRSKSIELGRSILELQLKYLDDQGLEWINKNLEKLVPLSQESKLLFRKLYHKLLQDEEITGLEEELIIKFMNQGLTTSITRNREIIFEGKKYRIKSKNDAQLLDAIATEVIDQDKDLLALQYKVYKPIFQKKCESGMKKASADVERVYSVLDRTQELTSDHWILAQLREETQGTLILLEKRSPIGDHVVYQLDRSKSGNHRIRVDIDDRKKELEDIFGQYVAGKKFQGRSTSLPLSEGNQILSNHSEDLEKLFEGKIAKEYFQQELLGLGSTDRIDFMDRELSTKLTDYEKVLANKLTDKISPETQVKIKEYFRAFVETFASAYTAAQVIASGQVQLNAGSTETKVLSTLASFVPFGGDGLSKVVSSVGEFLQSREMITNARIMKKLASDGTNLSQLVSETAMKIVLVQKKQNEITKITDEDLQAASGKLLEKISKFISNLNVKIDELIYTKKFSTPAAKLGNNDANRLIEHWVNQKIQSSSDAVTIQNSFVKLATEPTSPIEAGSSGNPERETRTACCSLF